MATHQENVNNEVNKIISIFESKYQLEDGWFVLSKFTVNNIEIKFRAHINGKLRKVFVFEVISNKNIFYSHRRSISTGNSIVGLGKFRKYVNKIVNNIETIEQSIKNAIMIYHNLLEKSHLNAEDNGLFFQISATSLDFQGTGSYGGMISLVSLFNLTVSYTSDKSPVRMLTSLLKTDTYGLQSIRELTLKSFLQLDSNEKVKEYLSR